MALKNFLESLLIARKSLMSVKCLKIFTHCSELFSGNFGKSKSNLIWKLAFLGLVWFLTSQSTAMVMSGRSVHLPTLFTWASLTKRLTSTVCILFRVGSHVVFAWIHCTGVQIDCTDILIECRKISLCFLIYTQKVIHHFPAHIFPYQMLPG